jgi:hypothetical protein
LVKCRSSLRIRTSSSSPDRHAVYRPQPCFERQVKTGSQTRVSRVIEARWRTLLQLLSRLGNLLAGKLARQNAITERAVSPSADYCAAQRNCECRVHDSAGRPRPLRPRRPGEGLRARRLQSAIVKNHTEFMHSWGMQCLFASNSGSVIEKCASAPYNTSLTTGAARSGVSLFRPVVTDPFLEPSERSAVCGTFPYSSTSTDAMS